MPIRLASAPPILTNSHPQNVPVVDLAAEGWTPGGEGRGGKADEYWNAANFVNIQVTLRRAYMYLGGTYG
jgi:hypothetical protein